MTPQQIIYIKNSWQQVASLDAVVVGQLFYDRLFELDRELRPLFKSPQPEQSVKLIAMLGYIVSRLDRLETLADDIS